MQTGFQQMKILLRQMQNHFQHVPKAFQKETDLQTSEAMSPSDKRSDVSATSEAMSPRDERSEVAARNQPVANKAAAAPARGASRATANF